MTVLITRDEAYISDGRFAFVCEGSDRVPTLVVFAEYWQQPELADILRATADQLHQPTSPGIRDL